MIPSNYNIPLGTMSIIRIATGATVFSTTNWYTPNSSCELTLNVMTAKKAIDVNNLVKNCQ